jgi:hypothetical protein
MNDEMKKSDSCRFILPHLSFIVEVMRGQVNDFPNSVNRKTATGA